MEREVSSSNNNEIRQRLLEEEGERASAVSSKSGGMLACMYFVFVTTPVLVFDGLRLLIFVILLSPGFARFFWYYVTCNRTVVKYAEDSCRNCLDIYGASVDDDDEIRTSQPPDSDSSSRSTGKPVLVFFPGGAWFIGYKMWGALTAKALTPFGILVVIADYRNYPWGTVPDAVEDINSTVQWTIDNCSAYGGDPKRIVVLGQSAGGHLGACAILRRALSLDDARRERSFVPTDLSGFVSLSAPFDLSIMRSTFHRHGMAHDLVDRIFGNQTEEYDPRRLVEAYGSSGERNIAERLPPIAIFHGSADQTVPYNGSKALSDTLADRGVSNVKFTLYPNWSHTDPILEGLMDADHRFHRDLLLLIQDWTQHEMAVDGLASNAECQRLCPMILTRAARCFMPF